MKIVPARNMMLAYHSALDETKGIVSAAIEALGPGPAGWARRYDSETLRVRLSSIDYFAGEARKIGTNYGELPEPVRTALVAIEELGGQVKEAVWPRGRVLAGADATNAWSDTHQKLNALKHRLTEASGVGPENFRDTPIDDRGLVDLPVDWYVWPT